jgi:hypothetical protein
VVIVVVFVVIIVSFIVFVIVIIIFTAAVVYFVLFFRVTGMKPLTPRPVPRDHTHPLHHERICHVYRDHNVLLKGLDQGKTLTKTVEVKNGLPVQIENLLGAQHMPDHDMLVQR